MISILFLGSQLKLMHNLRLLSADVLDLCRHKLNKVGYVCNLRLLSSAQYNYFLIEWCNIRKSA